MMWSQIIGDKPLPGLLTVKLSSEKTSPFDILIFATIDFEQSQYFSFHYLLAFLFLTLRLSQ